MSWWLMQEKHKRDGKLAEIKQFFKSIDKDDDDEVSREDWYEALKQSGAKATM